MKICLLCEGCYPYVVGGVSSWVQQLVKLFPSMRFLSMRLQRMNP